MLSLSVRSWKQSSTTHATANETRFRDVVISLLACATLILTHLAHSPASSSNKADPHSSHQEQLWSGAYVKLFRGPHIPKKLSKITVREPFNWQQTDERIGVFAFGTKLQDFLNGALTIEWEALYGDHWGTQDFHEIGAVLYARWNRFPWNDYIRTTFQVGMGPSLTSEPAHYEPKGGVKSLWLAQLNFEIDVYSPSNPGWALVFRIQHRSGIYTLINDVRGGSNFLTIGVRRQY